MSNTNSNTPILSRQSEKFRDARLHPKHLADLCKSGLSDATIKSACVYSVGKKDIRRKLGYALPQIESLLAFPYDNNEFERFKVFPSFKDKDGHEVKYLQPKGTSAHLYVPPQTKKILENGHNGAIAICEGEKRHYDWYKKASLLSASAGFGIGYMEGGLCQTSTKSHGRNALSVFIQILIRGNVQTC